MANEITILGGGGDGQFSVLFYFPVPANKRLPARDSSGSTTGANVVPSPSTELPAAWLPTTTETTALDAGESLVVQKSYRQQAGQTDAQFLAFLQARYAELKQPVLDQYNSRYTHSGKRFNAV